MHQKSVLTALDGGFFATIPGLPLLFNIFRKFSSPPFKRNLIRGFINVLVSSCFWLIQDWYKSLALDRKTTKCVYASIWFQSPCIYRFKYNSPVIYFFSTDMSLTISGLMPGDKTIFISRDNIHEIPFFFSKISYTKKFFIYQALLFYKMF